MPRPPTDPYWRERIRAITENERLGPGPIRRRFEGEAERGRRKDWPSERTIGRIQSEFRQLSEEERRPYREVHWPETFERGDLPWEASAAALELMRAWGRGSHVTDRPSLRLARWFWRMTQAAPDLEAKERMVFAAWLAGTEALPGLGPDPREALEGFLRYAPWRSEEAQTAYLAALAERRAPPFPLDMKFTVRLGRPPPGEEVTFVPKGAYFEVMRDLQGAGFTLGLRFENPRTGEVVDLPEETLVDFAHADIDYPKEEP